MQFILGFIVGTLAGVVILSFLKGGYHDEEE